MTGPRAEGFAAELLARAEGRQGPLRPRIAAYFSPQSTPEPLVEEVSLERPAPPPESVERPLRAETPRSAPEARADPPRAPQRANPVSDGRLMPPAPVIPPDPVPSPPDVEPTAPEARPVVPLEGAEPHKPAASPKAPGAAESAATEIAAGPDAPAPGRGSSPPLPDFGRALAEAIARLAPGTPEDAPERLMPQPEPVRPAAPPDALGAAAVPEAPQDGNAGQAAAPLHIHIGEIVIAPDPQSPPAQGPEPPRRPDWQPALSLDAYRDSRRRRGP